MIIRPSQIAIFLLALVLAASTCEAIHRAGGRLRGQTNRNLKKKKWGAQVSALELDDPEALAAQAVGGPAQKGQSKGRKPKPKSDEYNLENYVDSDEEEQSKRKPAPKGEDYVVAIAECDDPEDPNCIPEVDEPEDLILGDLFEGLTAEDIPVFTTEEEAIDQIEEETEMTPGTLLVGFLKVFQVVISSWSFLTTIAVADTMVREISPFKIAFSLSQPLYEEDLDDGDYAELSDNTQLHLTEYFRAYFEGEPADFYEATVRLQKTGDALVARFYVTTSFVIPGAVPTIANIYERMTDVFAGDEADSYVALLNGMGTGNPFRKTNSIALINEVPIAISGNGQSGSRPKIAESKARLLPVIIGSSMLLFVIAGLFWVRQQIRRAQKELELDNGEGQDEIPVTKPTNKETQKYLETIKKQYREDASNTELEDVSLEGGDDNEGNEEATQSTDNRQSLIELQEALNDINSLSQSHPEYENTLSIPAPPSQEFDDEELDAASTGTGSVAPFDEPKTEKEPRKELYMKYLDIVSDNSFDDDDLRN